MGCGAKPRTLRKKLVFHRKQELCVARRLFEARDEEVHGVDGGEIRETLAQEIDFFEFRGVVEELFFSRSALDEVDSWVDASVSEPSIEDEFHVARTFEFLEDHLVHARAGVDHGSGDDGERAALLDISSGAEEPFGFMERVRVDTAC